MPVGVVPPCLPRNSVFCVSKKGAIAYFISSIMEGKLGQTKALSRRVMTAMMQEQTFKLDELTIRFLESCQDYGFQDRERSS